MTTVHFQIQNIIERNAPEGVYCALNLAAWYYFFMRVNNKHRLFVVRLKLSYCLVCCAKTLNG